MTDSWNIAIVGYGCVAPGAGNAAQLWKNTIKNRIAIREVTEKDWQIPGESLLAESLKGDRIVSNRAGVVREFFLDEQWLPIQVRNLRYLDRGVHWVIASAQEAFARAKMRIEKPMRGGVILGNLSYPNYGLYQVVEQYWLNAIQNRPLFLPKHQENRFMSHQAANILATAYQCELGGYALDAACASSFYAIHNACLKLLSEEADMMLAGGLNSSHMLGLHLGFNALGALSQKGYSTPFSTKADGLVPGHGANVFILKRLEDAVSNADPIYGVIHGIGLANDGNAGGLLPPDKQGEIKAIELGLSHSGVSPKDIDWIECHATSTVKGDVTEIESLLTAYHGNPITIGALKANIGHCLTAAAGIGLCRTLEAMRAGVYPSTPFVKDSPIEPLQSGDFVVLESPKPWESSGIRFAALNAFGFGGNNSHMILSSFEASLVKPRRKNMQTVNASIKEQAVLKGHLTQVRLNLKINRFPPLALNQCSDQQLILLKLSEKHEDLLKQYPIGRVAVLIGMQCDLDVSRYIFRVKSRIHQWLSDELERDRLFPGATLDAALGNMPNLLANRIQFLNNLQAPGYAISAGEDSLRVAFEVAKDMMQAHQIDAALVGAVEAASTSLDEQIYRSSLGYGSRPIDEGVLFLIEKDEQGALFPLPECQSSTMESNYLVNAALLKWIQSHACSSVSG